MMRCALARKLASFKEGWVSECRLSFSKRFALSTYSAATPPWAAEGGDIALAAHQPTHSATGPWLFSVSSPRTRCNRSVQHLAPHGTTLLWPVPSLSAGWGTRGMGQRCGCGPTSPHVLQCLWRGQPQQLWNGFCGARPFLDSAPVPEGL